MKKIAALCLTLCLLLPLMLAARAGGGITLTLARVEGKVGDVVEIPLTASDNPGIVSLQVKIKFDEEKLQLISVKDGGILGKEIHHQEEKASPYVLSWENYVAKENFTENGVLCTLSFRVLSGEAGEELPVTMTVDDYGVMNFDLQDLPRSLNYGGVTVTESAAEAAPSPWAWVLAGFCIAIPVTAVLAVVLYDMWKKREKKA